MEQHCLGEIVHLGGAGTDQAAASVNRIEITRPDGSRIEKDWDRRKPTVRADRVGIWTWTLVLREEASTWSESGEFEVVGGKSESDEGQSIGLLKRLFSRR